MADYDWSSWRLTILGLEEAQAVNRRRLAALQPDGALGRAVRTTVEELQVYSKGITHRDTTALQAAHLGEVHGLSGRVHINPSAINPRGRRPVDYGPYEHARGGSHAFYDRTVRERGPSLANDVGYRLRVAVEEA